MQFQHVPVRNAQDATQNFEQLKLLLTTSEAKLARLPAAIATGEAVLEYTVKSKASGILKVATGLNTVTNVTLGVIGKGEVGVGVKVEGTEIALQAWFEKEELAAGTKVKVFWTAIGT